MTLALGNGEASCRVDDCYKWTSCLWGVDGAEAVYMRTDLHLADNPKELKNSLKLGLCLNG